MTNIGPEIETALLSSLEEVQFEAAARELQELSVEEEQATPEQPFSPALAVMKAAGLLYGTHCMQHTELPNKPALIVTDFADIKAFKSTSRVVEAILIDGESIRHYGIDDETGDVMLVTQTYMCRENEGSRKIIEDALTPPHAIAPDGIANQHLRIFSGAAYRELFTKRACGVRYGANPSAADQLHADLLTFTDDSTGLTRINPPSATWELYKAEVTPMDGLMIAIDS